MNVIVLMAGDGARFKEVGYPAPKPFIEVGDKHILEWTTRSLPFINHYADSQNCNLIFAIRKEHDDQFQVADRLKSIYGSTVKTVVFDELTRGNLETAYIAAQAIDNDDDILFLDSDNYYDGSGLRSFIDRFADEYSSFASICYFEPTDRSYKWCFAFPDGYRITKLGEKDKFALDEGGKPMVGVFYFNTKKLFTDAAEKILNKGRTVANEFFMSQSISNLIADEVPVFGLEVTNVVPLGTPKDIIAARDVLYDVVT